MEKNDRIPGKRYQFLIKILPSKWLPFLSTPHQTHCPPPPLWPGGGVFVEGLYKESSSVGHVLAVPVGKPNPDAGRTTKFAPVKSLWFSELIPRILLFEFRFAVFLSFGLWGGFMNPPPSVFSNSERKSPQRGLWRSIEPWRYQCSFPAPSWAPN